jgi:uncharacterized membrane-anchored protein YitT (DUF2179 family)
MKKALKIIYELIAITIGCGIQAFAINMFIFHVHLLSGGVTGISIIINNLLPLGVGVLYLILNIPLLIIGYIHIGKKFSLYTIYCVLILSILIDTIHIKHYWTDNVLLCAIFGAVSSSIGSIIVLRFGGSTGGLDIIGRVIAKYKDITIGKFNLSINILIILLSTILFQIEIAMYTIISIYVSMIAYDNLLNHVGRISVFIITDKGEKVSESITKNMKRGVTVINANGGYTNTERQVLMSVIVNVQWNEFKKIVKEEDENAFIFVLPTQSVVGNFNKVW